MSQLDRTKTPHSARLTRSRPGGGRYSVLLLALALCVSGGFAPEAESPSDFEIKSAFITRFLQFVEWSPPRPANGRTTPLVAVLGESPFCTQLPAALAKLPPNERPSVVREAQPVHALQADVVVVCESERSRLGSLVRTLEQSRALTVAESSGFGSGGVMLNMYVASDRHVRFEANTSAAARAGIRMSSHLLRMARIVG